MFKTQGKSPAKSMPFNRRETMDKAVVVCAGSPPPPFFYFPALNLLVSFLLAAGYFAL